MAIDPEWLDEGLAHVWLPYAQMKTAPRPLPVVATEGARLVLADGRTLVDGIAQARAAIADGRAAATLEALKRASNG